MTGEFLFLALGGISVLTTLTVEAIKKLLGDKKYSANLLAAMVAVVLSIAVCVCYIVYYSVAITSQVIVTILAMVFLSFLASTVGFDKVKQMLQQLGL